LNRFSIFVARFKEMKRNADFEHILIGGLQRSGTSMVRAVIGSHPDIAIVQSDLALWTKFSNIYKDGLTQKQWNRLCKEVLTHKKSIKSEIQIGREDLESEYTQMEIPVNFADFYRLYMEAYLRKTGKKTVGLKTPHNEFMMDRVFGLFPKTRFVHVIRNPLDVAVSLNKAKKQWFEGSVNFMEHIYWWKKSFSIAMQYQKERPGNYLVLVYEDLIREGVTKVREVCQFLNVEYDPIMMLMGGHPGWKGSNSSFDQQKKTVGFTSQSINRYKAQLPEDLKELYYSLLYTEMNQLNYEVEERFIQESDNLVSKFKIEALKADAKMKLERYIQGSKVYRPLKRALNK
jgi:hypothetical protein